MRSSRRFCIAAIAEAKCSTHGPNRHEISNQKPTGNGGVCHRKNDSRVTVAKAEKFSMTSTANTPPKSTITASIIDNTVSLYMNYVPAVYVLKINTSSGYFSVVCIGIFRKIAHRGDLKLRNVGLRQALRFFHQLMGLYRSFLFEFFSLALCVQLCDDICTKWTHEQGYKQMSRISRRTWIMLIIIGFLTASAALLGNIGAGALTFLSPQLALVLFVLISATLIAIELRRAHTESSAELSPVLQQQNRKRMLDRVYRKWIVEYLEDELRYDEELIHLPLRKLSTGRWDLAIRRLDAPAQPLPADTRITEVYDQARGDELLILGDPGSGKTTLLLELTRDLIERTRMQDDLPIPVVLTLSSWTAKQRSIEEWLIEELWTKYQVQRQIGRALVENHQLLLLLDGLDEVAPAYQEACIEALNEYRRDHQRPMVVSSRKNEYLHLSTQLHLRTAVLLHPLTLQQIDAYLTELGGEVAGLQVALRKSTTLQQLATTPFVLKVLILTYHDVSLRELLTLVAAPSTDLLQYQLFHAYVERMLQHPGALTHYTMQQIRRWLVWLARQTVQHNQIEFYIERMQPYWLPSPWLIWLYRIVIGLIGGLLGGLVFGLISWRGSELLGGLAVVLFFVLINIDHTEIKPAEVIVWSWENKNMRQRLVALFITLLLVALVAGLVVGLLHGLVFGLIAGLSFGLLGLVLGGLNLGLIEGFSSELLDERNL